MPQSQRELYQELEKQGMPKAGCKFIAMQFKNKEQEHIMMKYLISIRKEHIAVTQVGIMADKIKDTM